MEGMRFRLGGSNARWLRGSGIVSVLVLLILPSLVGMESFAAAQRDDLDYENEMANGLALMRRHQYEEALKSFKRASDLRERKSPECFLWMAEAYQGLEAYKNVLDSCDKAVELAGGDKALKARAYNLKGIALQS